MLRKSDLYCFLSAVSVCSLTVVLTMSNWILVRTLACAMHLNVGFLLCVCESERDEMSEDGDRPGFHWGQTTEGGDEDDGSINGGRVEGRKEGSRRNG